MSHIVALTTRASSGFPPTSIREPASVDMAATWLDQSAAGPIATAATSPFSAEKSGESTVLVLPRLLLTVFGVGVVILPTGSASIEVWMVRSSVIEPVVPGATVSVVASGLLQSVWQPATVARPLTLVSALKVTPVQQAAPGTVVGAGVTSMSTVIAGAGTVTATVSGAFPTVLLHVTSSTSRCASARLA